MRSSAQRRPRPVLASTGWGRRGACRSARLARPARLHRAALRARRAALPARRAPRPELARAGAAYQWARGERGQSIALGGTTGAFFQYGLYGPDSSNRVTYLGERGPRGSLKEITSCAGWRQAIDDGGYRFVVTSPGYNQDDPSRPLPAPFTGWTASDPAAKPVVQANLVTVFEIEGKLDPKTCR